MEWFRIFLALAEGTPVVGGGADNACAAVGAGIIEEGTVQSSIGSSGVVLAALSEHRVDERMRLHCMNHAAPDRWYLMGVMLTAGLSLKWFKENLCHAEIEQAQAKGVDAYDLLSEMAASVPPGAEGLLFLPYLSGERTPHADSDARAMFVGLSLRHTKAHMARAVMEGLAFGLRDSLGTDPGTRYRHRGNRPRRRRREESPVAADTGRRVRAERVHAESDGRGPVRRGAASGSGSGHLFELRRRRKGDRQKGVRDRP